MSQLDYINWLYLTLGGDPGLREYFASGEAAADALRDRKTTIAKLRKLEYQYRGTKPTDVEIEGRIDRAEKVAARGFDEAICPQYVESREHVFSVLPSSIIREIENVPVILLPTMSPNAHALLTPKDDTIIVISLGLDTLLHTVDDNLTRMAGTEGSRRVTDEHKLWIEQTMACVEAFVSGGYQHLGRASFPDHFRTVSIVSTLHKVQKSWILAHEYAHMIKKHLSKKRVTEWSLPTSESLRLRWYKNKKNQEFEADEYATNIVCQLYGGQAIWALRIMLTFFDFCDQVRDHRMGMPNQNEPSTHPSSIERLDRVKHTLGKYFDQRTIDTYGVFPDAVEAWFKHISSNLSNSYKMRDPAMRKEVLRDIVVKMAKDRDFFKQVLMQPKIALANYNLTSDELSVIVAKTVELVTTSEEFMHLDRIISYCNEAKHRRWRAKKLKRMGGSNEE